MDILEKALRAHAEGRSTVRDNALSRAEQIGLLDPEVLFRTNAVKFMCGVANLSEVVPHNHSFTADQVNTLGWAGTTVLASRPQLSLDLSLALISYGTRFKVLALRAQALLNCIDQDLVVNIAPRALERAVEASQGLAKARLLAAAALTPSFADRSVEAIKLLVEFEDYTSALNTAAEVYAADPSVEIAVAAAEAATVAVNREALKFWLSVCPPHESSYVAAMAAPSLQRWVKAVDARLEEGICDLRFSKGVSSAFSFGADADQLKVWASRSRFSDSAAALRMATTLLSAELPAEAVNVCQQFPNDPSCVLLAASHTENLSDALTAVRSVATSPDSSPSSILEAVTFLVNNDQQPFGSLIALLDRSDASDEQVVSAADLLTRLVISGSSGSIATGKALLSAVDRRAGTHAQQAMWRYFAARCGVRLPRHPEDFDMGNPLLSGWEFLAKAEAAAQKNDLGTFITALTDSHGCVSLSGDTALGAAVKDLTSRFVK